MPTPNGNNSDKPGGLEKATRETTALSTERASDSLARWEKSLGGRSTLADALILGNLTPQLSHLVRLLTGSRYQEHTLLRLCTDAGVAPYEVMELYRKTSFLKGQTIAIVKTAEAMPALIKELTAKAISHMTVCMRCKGLGFVQPKHKPTAADEDQPTEPVTCKVCVGTGELFVEADEKAQQKLLNILQLGPKQTTVTAVKVDVNNNSPSQGFSALVKDSDDAARSIDGELLTADVDSAVSEGAPNVPPQGR